MVFALTALALSLLACQSHQTHARKAAIAEPSSTATVTIHQAVDVASQMESGTVIEAKLDEEDGKLVWEVEILKADGKEIEIHVDAHTGEAHVD